ncbi:hypothetical protein PCI56_07330 [Plesiomonas shigelloides subsp. oncorhynchi]|nr:hypothetical protein [Plesiomonas shigelloides]
MTTYTLTRSMSWSYSYLTVGGVALVTMLIAALTNFRRCEQSTESSDNAKSEWNFGLLSGGLVCSWACWRCIPF